MPGLGPGIHVFLLCKQDVDGRDKPGHDEWIMGAAARFAKSGSGAYFPAQKGALALVPIGFRPAAISAIGKRPP